MLLKSPYTEIVIPEVAIHQALFAAMSNYEERTALVSALKWTVCSFLMEASSIRVYDYFIHSPWILNSCEKSSLWYNYM